MKPVLRTLLSVLVLSSVGLAQSPQLIAPTDPLPPEEQRAKFHLPPGFEIQLVVAEDVIGQPMNLNFDAAGRLWVTSSIEYPYPAKGEGVERRDARFGAPADHGPRDRVVVLDGIGADGKPDTVTVFAEGRNIPIGICPTDDGTLVYSIPAIELLRDTDGDGRADATTRLFDGFGNVDTHGMNNGFTRWIDGWIYACHGFRNTSKVRMATREGDAREEVVLTLNSGNTYRFKEDGSAIQQFTWGQVNPYGLTFDEWGNAFTGDCHSMPLTGLIRGAYYSSFGKPHDGLGFGPDMIDHNHGSTGICGPAYYMAAHYPPAYRGNLFLCNPVTGRVHRDELVDKGSTRFVKSLPDFVTCDDPWFRPVDCQLGPDGCLYVADFYNAIIGHYEVPLNNPKRDRTHGRVWRIVYRGEDGSIQPPPLPNLETMTAEELVERLGDPNIVVRMLATNRLVDSGADDSVDPRIRELLDANRNDSPERRAHALWVAERLRPLGDDEVDRLVEDPSPLVRTHLARVLGERASLSKSARNSLLQLFVDDNPFAQRAAADALGRHPSMSASDAFLRQLAEVPNDDTHLRHTIRVALRDNLRDGGVAREYEHFVPVVRGEADALASVALAVPTQSAAAYLVHWAGKNGPETLQRGPYARHVAAHGTDAIIDGLAELLQGFYGDEPRTLHGHLLAVREGLAASGRQPSERLRGTTAKLALDFLESGDGDRVTWRSTGSVADPWAVEQRRSSDGRAGEFVSTLPRGEQVTATRRSSAFELPLNLSFFVAGHRGSPENEAGHRRNAVRLRDAETGIVLFEALAPRNDTAQRVSWFLGRHRGKRGYLEIVDGDTERAYAWISVGRFSPESLNTGAFDPLTAATSLVRDFRLEEMKPRLQAIVEDDTAPSTRRVAAARSLEALAPESRLRALLDVAADPRTADDLRTGVISVVADRENESIEKTLVAATRVLPESRQREFAATLAGDRVGGEALLRLVEAGHLAPRLLADEALANRLIAARAENAKSRIADLTRELPSTDARIAEAIAAHRRSFAAGSPDVERGRLAFEKTCAACHRIGTKGALIGPQLDGVGIRGLDRLLEDVLDPNRNVDGAFRTTTVVTNGGKVHVGLFRREEGATLVFADQKGKEFTVPAADVDTRVKSATSLMPANLHEVLKPDEIDDLLRYLLEQRRKPDAE